MGGGDKRLKPESILRDIRRYRCEYCGITRSKKSLLTSHLLFVHQDEMKSRSAAEINGTTKSNTCNDCGATFSKPAYLKQHMQSLS